MSSLSVLEQEVRRLISVTYSPFEQECLTTSLDQVIEKVQSNEDNLRNVLYASKDFMTRVPVSSLSHQRFLKSFQQDYICSDSGFSGMVEVFRMSQVQFGDDPEIINHIRAFTLCHKDVEKLNRCSLQYLEKIRNFSHIKKQIIKSLNMCASKEITNVLNSYGEIYQEEVFKIIFDSSYCNDATFNNIIEVYSNYGGDNEVHKVLKSFSRENILNFVCDYNKLLKKTRDNNQFDEINHLFNKYLVGSLRHSSLGKEVCDYLIKQSNLNDFLAYSVYDYFYHIRDGFRNQELADTMNLREVNKITFAFNFSRERFPEQSWSYKSAKRQFIEFLREVEGLGDNTNQRKRDILEWCDGLVKGIHFADMNGQLYKNSLVVNGYV
ncbi:hypothetical protein HN385_03415 [archaeon]|jgi:hypothetical protein|nr:hypothetical protein [archaeon]MBT3451495.1 hypothetical protein [archaeon]MBT6869745.1 hypothetical protein [archaeon]MBT7192700.1 hypothetical protein [archaeon]MBT7380725.1 hypothetical protein [archaeon]